MGDENVEEAAPSGDGSMTTLCTSKASPLVLSFYSLTAGPVSTAMVSSPLVRVPASCWVLGAVLNDAHASRR